MRGPSAIELGGGGAAARVLDGRRGGVPWCGAAVRHNDWSVRTTDVPGSGGPVSRRRPGHPGPRRRPPSIY
ncbi:hypothetical protein NKG94_22035 [Micromonospora sp. M12]